MKLTISESPLNHDSRQMKIMRGFTLVEVLIVITIVIVLAAISFSTTKHLRRSASSAVCVSKMNQIGNAFLIFAQDRGGRYPVGAGGTLHTGQGPWYNLEDRRLQNHLGEYLGCPKATNWSNNPDLAAFDSTFAWPGLLADGKKGSPSVVLNDKVKILVDSVTKTESPWGKMLDRIEEPGKQVVFGEVDQKNSNAGWKNQLPPGPIHGSYRNCLYFDWHVGRVPVNP